MQPKLLDRAHEILGWPRREDLFNPSGAAKSVMAKAADRKIGNSVRRFEEAAGARVGILSGNPASDTTESPLALVCEFPRPVSERVFREAQRLAWNFSLSPMLITVEPHIIRSFTCCEQTSEKVHPDRYVVKTILEKELSLSEEAARVLHWVSLISGEFFKINEHRFQRDQRADHLLLSNLEDVRNKLLSEEYDLDRDICHDLLARVIFIQFLMDRKGLDGTPALDSSRLQQITGHKSFEQVLRHKEDAYGLFGDLNKRFNGDLFAGNGHSDEDGSLLREKARVEQRHLNLLADLVEGKLQMKSGQLCLWRQYAFDVIPLEFISSIYEGFVTKVSKKEGAYYTPQHLVDFVLDGVLPWSGDTWDLKVMDPACGSAVFLVKAFQRLVYRWRAVHDWQQPSPDVLRKLLDQNVFGVDSNDHAVKVASFSLYLAMCDHIEPADLWNETSFPKLRGQRIVCSDFFSEDTPGFRTVEDAGTYDLIVGNPPWGARSLSEPAKEWARSRDWVVSNKNFGPLFIPKCAALTRHEGIVSMLQPTKALLFNRSGTAQVFRRKLFRQFEVEEVTNLAAVRFEHFKGSDSPTCIITLRPKTPSGEPFTYICPKPAKAAHDKNLIIIDPQDVNTVFPHEAAEQGHVWTALMWGGRRDLLFIKKYFDTKKYARLKNCKRMSYRLGIRGGKDNVEHPDIVGMRILTADDDIKESFLQIESENLRIRTDPFVHRKTDLMAFRIPQLVIRCSWLVEEERFRAFLIIPEESGKGVLTTNAFISINAPNDEVKTLESACVTFNSIFSVYYLLLTSGRFAGERPNILVDEVMNIPIIPDAEGLFHELDTFNDIDDRVCKGFEFSEVEWSLIQDMTKYTIPYFKSDKSYPADPTRRQKTGDSELELYAEYFARVLKAGFGADKQITCVAYTENNHQTKLPVRLMAIYLDSPFEIGYETEDVDNEQLYALLAKLHSNLMDLRSSNSGGFFFQRIARLYDVTEMEGRRVPTVYIIKPDQVRYWTRSMALRDADEVAADILSWGTNDSGTGRDKEITVEPTAHPF